MGQNNANFELSGILETKENPQAKFQLSLFYASLQTAEIKRFNSEIEQSKGKF